MELLNFYNNITIIIIVILQEAFDIIDGLSGSTTFYYLLLTDDIFSGITCNSTPTGIRIPASSFVNGVYTYVLNSSSRIHHNSELISIRFSATNVLGSGPSHNTTVGTET